MQNNDQFSISKKIYFILVLISSIFIVVSSYLYYQFEADNVRRDKYNELKAIARLKTSQIVEWRNNTLSQVAVISHSPVLIKTVDVYLKYPMYYKNDIVRRFKLDIENYNYENILMTDTSGRIIISGTGIPDHLDAAVMPAFKDALKSGEIIFSDFYKCQFENKIHYDIIAPLINEHNRIIVVLVIRVDPNLYFYPLIESWPTPSKTSETVLVRKDGDKIVFISKLRNYKDAVLNLKFPLTKKETPAVRAALGERGIYFGKDYRDVNVLSYIGRVPNTPWLMVSKIDESELLRLLNYKAAIMILFSILLLAFLWTFLGLIYNRRQRTIYGKLLEVQEQAQSISQQRQLALDAANLGWWHFNPLDNSVWCDEKFKKIFGISGEVKTKDDVLSRIHHDDFTIVDASAAAALNPNDPKPYSIEYRVIHSDGSVHWVESHGIATFEGEPGRRIPIRFVGTIQDTTERKQLEEGLRRRVEEMETIMDVAPALIWIANDPECNIIRGNTMANEFYRAQTKENVSANISDARRFFRNGVELKPEELPMQKAARMNKSVNNEEIEVLLPDGNRLFMIGSACPLRDIDGLVRGCVSAFMDVTEIKKAQLKLEQTLKELQRSNRELEQFAYIASHDLQEPIRMIKVFVEMLRRKTIESEQVDEYINFISDGASRMHHLINALLEYSKLISGEIAFEKLDCNEVLKDVLSDLRLMIEETSAKILFKDLPEINGKKTMIHQLFQNLIQNAIKFRSDANPEISISNLKENGSYVIKVQDNGIGIAPEYYEKIFLIFQKLHSNDTYTGTGIGLASCKKIVELHGGRIYVDSIPGKGSSFYVTFPVPYEKHYPAPALIEHSF